MVRINKYDGPDLHTFKFKFVLQSLGGVRTPCVHCVYTLSIRPHIAYFFISFLSRNPLSLFCLFWHSSLVPFPSAVFDWSKKQTDLFTEGQPDRLAIVRRRNHHSCVCLIAMETVSARSSQAPACEQLQKQNEPCVEIRNVNQQDAGTGGGGWRSLLRAPGDQLV